MLAACCVLRRTDEGSASFRNLTSPHLDPGCHPARGSRRRSLPGTADTPSAEPSQHASLQITASCSCFQAPSRSASLNVFGERRRLHAVVRLSAAVHVEFSRSGSIRVLCFNDSGWLEGTKVLPISSQLLQNLTWGVRTETAEVFDSTVELNGSRGFNAAHLYIFLLGK